MRIRWTLRAVSDLEPIDAFVKQEGDAAAAAAQIRRVVDAIQVIAAFPDAGRSGRVSGTRELSWPSAWALGVAMASALPTAQARPVADVGVAEAMVARCRHAPHERKRRR